MSSDEYLLVESQPPGSGPGGGWFLRDAAAVARTGAVTRLLLVQDGVFAVGPGTSGQLDRIRDAGAELWIDDFSWRQRAMGGAATPAGSRRSDMDMVAERVLDPAVRVVWH